MISLEPLLVGLGVGAICVIVHLYARAQQRRGRALGRPQTGRITWPGSFSSAFQRVLDLLPILRADLIDADPNRGDILAAGPADFATSGTTLRFRLATVEGVTIVEIEAAPSAHIFDWGASRRMIDRILREWDRLPGPVETARRV